MNLTREQIENMPAGKEMDALVAELVMGGFVKYPEEWSKEKENWYWLHPKAGVLVGRPYLLPQITKEAMGMYSHQYEAWKPSEDISAAWEVVEKINKMIYQKKLSYDYNYLTLDCLGFHDGYAASFDSNLNAEWYEDIENCKFAAHADTAPLAICRAALIAVLEAR